MGNVIHELRANPGIIPVLPDEESPPSRTGDDVNCFNAALIRFDEKRVSLGSTQPEIPPLNKGFLDAVSASTGRASQSHRADGYDLHKYSTSWSTES